MWKKVVAILVVVAAALGLAVWGVGPKSIATTDSGSISQADYYKKLKSTTEGQQQLANMIIQKVLDKKYGDKVSSKAITKQYDDVKAQYGSQFSTALANNGMTEDSFKESLELQALEKAAVEANSKFTTKQLKEQYKNYTPNVNVSVILVSSEDEAKDMISKLDDGDKFATLAKKYSTDSSTKDKGGKMDAFDSTNTTLEDDFKTAAFKLKKGEYTKTPVKSDTYSGYFVIKMDSRDDKKSFTTLKSKMKEILVTNEMSDSSKVQAIIGNELAKANVNIKDLQLKNVLATYTQAAATAKAAKTSSSSSESSSSKASSSASSSSSEASSSSAASSESSDK